jgi:uncharacterized protein (DUF58 family)
MPDKKSGFSLSLSGFQFMLVILAMLIAGINYSNTMAYLLAFLCLSLMVVSMPVARYSASGLVFKSIQPQPAFAGGQMRIAVEVENNAKQKCRAYFINIPDQNGIRRSSGPYSIDPGSVAAIDIFVPVPRRGLHTLDGMVFETFFPLGLLRFRKPAVPGENYLVFPMPAGHKPWPAPRTVWFENIEGFHFSGGDDFTGLRPYRAGEPQHHIDWKAYARGRPLSIKEFSSGGSLQVWFEWSALPGLGVEERLSQLTRWILEAYQQGMEFGLRLPDHSFEPDFSSLHTQKCLRALALFGDRP